MPFQNGMRAAGMFGQSALIDTVQQTAVQMPGVAAQTPNIETFKRCPRSDQGFVIGQQHLGIADRRAAGFLQRGKTIDEVPGGDQNRFLIKQVFNLWPVDQKPLVRAHDHILL